ncbi:MAG: hypothetical protein EHM61_11435 [Acidobacteria bacterium]|nr:MAG: hypothetical protein EHM61_11435 [Acidobacteriota bacterium]
MHPGNTNEPEADWSGRTLAPFLAAFIGIAPLIVANSALHDYAELPKALFVKIGTLLLVLTAILVPKASRARLRLVATPLDKPILAFLVWASLSVIWAYDKQVALLRLSHFLAAWLIYLVIRERAGKREQSLLLVSLGCSSLVVSLLGLLQAWQGVEWVVQTRSPASTFGNKLLAGDFVVFVIPFLLILLLERSMVRRLLGGVALACNLAYLVAAVTKGAVLAVAAEAGAITLILALPWLFSGKRGRVKVLASALVLLLAILFVGSTAETNWIPQAWRSQFQLIGRTVGVQLLGNPGDPDTPRGPMVQVDDSALSLRLAVWNNTLSLLRDHPLFGVGLDNFQVFYPAYAFSRAIDIRVIMNQEWPQAHNDYLQTLAELGVVGVLLAGWFLWKIWKCSVPLLRETGSRLIAIACLTAIVGLLADMVFNFPLQTSIGPLMAAVCLGLIASHFKTLRRSQHAERLKAGSWPAGLQTVAPFLAGLLVLAGIWSEARLVLGSYHLARTLEARTQQDWAAVVSSGGKTLRYAPRSYEALQLISEALYLADQPAAAARAAEGVLKIRPYYKNALHNLAVAREKSGDRLGALDAYQRLVRIAPYNAQTHAAIGRICLSEKRYAEAADSFSAACQHDPKDGSYNFGLGLACYHSRFFGQASEAFRKAVDKAPANAEFNYYLGLSEIELGKLEDAEVHLAKAVQIRPELQRARALLRRLAALRSERRAGR